jgi:hypothetical protein
MLWPSRFPRSVTGPREPYSKLTSSSSNGEESLSSAMSEPAVVATPRCQERIASPASNPASSVADPLTISSTTIPTGGLFEIVLGSAPTARARAKNPIVTEAASRKSLVIVKLLPNAGPVELDTAKPASHPTASRR